MTLTRGRVLRGTPAEPIPLSPSASRKPTRLPSEVADAHARADVVLKAAEQRALGLLRAAEQNAAETRLRAEEVGRADGLAEAARVLSALRAQEAEQDARALDRTITLARLLAERLVGKALELAPGLVASLAKQVVTEARGARSIALFTHPEDVPLLARLMAQLDPDGRVHSVSPDPALGRGDLRLETDVGVLEARLAPSLERLAARLAGALRT